LSAVLLISTGFVFNSLYFADLENVPQVVESNFQSRVKPGQTIESTLSRSESANIFPASDEKTAVSNASSAAIVR
jgi:hypothetical protein